MNYMRKIISKHEEDRKKKRNQIMIGGILILVMVLSTLGYAIQSNFAGNGNTIANSSQIVTYNGIKFFSQNGLWTVERNNKKFIFSYNPTETPSTDLSNLTISARDISDKPLYIYSYDNFAELEVKTNLMNISSKIQSIQTPNCNENSVIIENGTLGVRQNQSCIFISGQGEDLIKLIDNVLFKILGMK